jgi:hypothetical protein
MVNRLFCDFLPSLYTKLTTCVRVHVKSWKVATGDIKADTMAFLENVGSWVELKGELVDFARIEQFGLFPTVTIASTDN